MSVLSASDDRAYAYAAAPFEVLDKCHLEILAMLNELRELVDEVYRHGDSLSTQEMARRTHLFFATKAINHHIDEERHIFPPLLNSGNEGLVNAIKCMQQHHSWLESNWLELVPRLDAMARGYGWPDMSEVRLCVELFTDLYEEHIAMEESLIYPQAKARLSIHDLQVMSREMAQRRGRGNCSTVHDELDDD